jgi:quercetin dioxygenase-like cupin family protein
MFMRKISVVFVLLCSIFSASAQYNKDVEIKIILKTDTTSIGQKILYPDFKNDEVTMAKVTIPPGKSTGWHKHVFPVFGYVIQGTLTVEIENRKPVQYPVNSAFSEVINTLHNGVNNGNEDVILIAFFMGEKGKTLSVH